MPITNFLALNQRDLKRISPKRKYCFTLTWPKYTKKITTCTNSLHEITVILSKVKLWTQIRWNTRARTLVSTTSSALTMSKKVNLVISQLAGDCYKTTPLHSLATNGSRTTSIVSMRKSSATMQRSSRNRIPACESRAR